jgi:hypothetical protein
VHRKDADTKGQPSIIVNPLRHNGIIGSPSGQVKRSSLLARLLGLWGCAARRNAWYLSSCEGVPSRFLSPGGVCGILT